MPNPVGHPPAIVHPQQPGQEGELIRPPAPGGSGAAPTTVEPPPSREVGYVETAVIFIKTLIIKLFSWIFFCFKREGEPAAENPPVGEVAPAEGQAANREGEAAQRQNGGPAPEPAAPLLQLQPRIQEDIDLLTEFGRFPEAAQNRIYIEIGRARAFRFMRWGDDLTYGKNQVQQNPQILLGFMRSNRRV